MTPAISWLQAAILGALQGLTEFLPVSSSGHLVLGQAALGIEGPELLFDITLHIGTLGAVLFFYGKDVWRTLRAWLLSVAGKAEGEDRISSRTAWMVIAGTLPAAFAGLFFEKTIEAAFSSPRLVALALLVTGGILFLTRFRGGDRRGEGALRLSDALLIGLFQALALVPGISRSGATIAAALFLGIERETAARFSFLLSVPAILGAFVLKTARFSPDATTSAGLGAILFGTAVSAVVGAIALGWLLHFIRRGNLRVFAYYCWALGVSVILFL